MRQDLRVSLFGYAKTTKALSRLFKNATFYDDACHKPFRDERGRWVRPSSEFDPLRSDLEIPSPGIAPTHPLIQSAKNLASEYDLFADTKPLKIWISGTNGKTTTTQMMQHLLAERGSVAGGNIGTPLADLEANKPIWILESSSFTLHYNTKATPNIYILLPITPDHLSWHGSMSEYEKAKLKPLATMREGELAIIPKKYASTPTNAFVVAYEDEADLASYFGIESHRLKFKGAFLLDALLAMAVDKALFDTKNYDKLNAFVLEAHRQEELRDAKGRLWVNDSKATNLDATIVAMKRYDSHFVHLILGGDDKGVDLDELFEFLAQKKLTLYIIGSNQPKLLNLAYTHHIQAIACYTLQNAISQIDLAMRGGEVALLSPAAASLDQFSSYAQRGELFKTYIKDLL